MGVTMDFTIITEQKAREKYKMARDKPRMIHVLAEMTGATGEEMAAFLGVPYQHHFFRLQGTNVRELYDAGLTDGEIGKKLCASASAVQYWRKRNGLRPNHLIKVSWEDAAPWYEEGLNDSQIAKKIGVTHGTIGKWRRDRGLENNYWKKDDSTVHRRMYTN